MSCPHGNPIGGCDTCDEVDAAFEAGKRSALAEQPAQQEPVADVVSGKTFDQFVALNESNAARVLELDELCETLQEKTYSQAMRIAELEAQLSQPAQQKPDWLDKEQAETDWDHVWLLIKAASYASSRGFISGTTNWGSAVSRYMRNESPQPAQQEQEPVKFEAVWNSGPTNKDYEDAMRLKRLQQLTSPPASKPWVGLTKEDRYKAIRPLYCDDATAALAACHSNDEYEAIEAKLREKNA